MTRPRGLDLADGARGAVLVASLGLMLFLGLLVLIQGSGWIVFPLAPVAGLVAALAVVNAALSRLPLGWMSRPWHAWAYETFHATVFTGVLHLFGGVSVGVFLPIYGFLVVHTEVLHPGASPFVTANVCALCFAILAALEHAGLARSEGMLAVPLSPGGRVAFVLFATLSFNFLALYAHRHGRRLRDLAGRLEQMVGERTAELVDANAELAAAAAALEQKERELRTFVYAVTHDLKNPFNAILLTARLVLQRASGTMDPETRDDLDLIQRTAAQGEDMLRDLLALFQVTSTAEPPGVVDLDALVHEALETLHPKMTARGVRATAQPLPRVRGQPEKLRHVLANLLDNAVKYAPRGCGEVSIVGHQENAHVALEIRDNGSGIPAAYQRRIFDLFGRVPSSGQQGDGMATGSGVGLALVKQIVESHNGRVWVESTPGAGSRFVVELPAAPARPEPA